MDTHKDLLVCGYLRRLNNIIEYLIPTTIINELSAYSASFTIYGIGQNANGHFW